MQDQDNETFKDLLKANIDKHMQMTIYSSKTQQLRGTQLLNNLLLKSLTLNSATLQVTT